MLGLINFATQKPNLDEANEGLAGHFFLAVLAICIAYYCMLKPGDLHKLPFLLSTPSRWVLVASDWAILKQLGHADERILSMQAAADERNSTSYLLSSSIHSNPYHIELILRRLTPLIEALIPDVLEEVGLAFDEHTGSCSEWVELPQLEVLLTRCVSIATSRVLVGHNLCRDEEYIESLTRLSHSAPRAGLLCSLVPRTLKPLVARWLVHQSYEFQTFLEKVMPLVKNRRRIITTEREGGEEQTGDAIQWICDAAPTTETDCEVCMRILYIYISAIGTTSTAIGQAVYDLAENAKFQDPIRDEIVSIVQEFRGWSKSSLNKMRKLDSSIKESQRLHPVTTATMMRKAQKSCTLADGTTLPQGRWVVVPAYSINRSSQWHDEPDMFDAFRFSRLTERDSFGNRHGIVIPGRGFLTFGIGKHAWLDTVISY
ncbi:unnamed protein product [Clonostachys byssicola]|uniref:Cytochrome P450 n=1 Tax=Clonostachys byssicola TaxID=160290 RepID=A0A9N9Y1Z2_9HYPO|nr:unnamed protein product [Clonostachys byssicola]